MSRSIGQCFLAAFVLLFSVPIAWGQSYKPAVEYQSLMNMRFYENTGGFLVEQLELVFPPSDIQTASLVITKSSGEEVGNVPLRYQPMQFPAFGLLLPDGVPGNIKVGASGDYVMSVNLDGQPVTSLPFSLQEQSGSDPFNPVKKFVRQGPFGELAYFSVASDSPGGELQFNWWMSLRELPPATQNAKVTLHLLANGDELAASSTPVIPTVNDWQFFQHQQLNVSSSPHDHWLTLADLSRQSGELTLVVEANGQRLKSYKTQVKDGQLQGLPQSRLGLEPQTSFISPKFIDMSSGSSSRYAMFDMYWAKAAN